MEGGFFLVQHINLEYKGQNIRGIELSVMMSRPGLLNLTTLTTQAMPLNVNGNWKTTP
ncbi:hypothetical protein [Methanosarcina horonobensis]|uniref:hypothetical protein n=1 Tax=Methanosarcina horonobensis TaxID=418008 RepID=UPI000A4784DC|nr:hypothetical protein [Methanosarcina horonobensis]